MRLPNLPSVCWQLSSLELIVGAAGKLIRLDDATSAMTKGRFCRVVVEVDTAFPLVPGTDVELEGLDFPVFWQRFEFEHIHLFCSSCGCVGYSTSDCKSSPIRPSVSSPVTTNKGSPSSPLVMPDCSATLPSDVPMGVEPPVFADDDLPVPMPWIHRRRGLQRQPGTRGSSGRSSARAVARVPTLASLEASPSLLGPGPRDGAELTSDSTGHLCCMDAGAGTRIRHEH